MSEPAISFETPSTEELLECAARRCSLHTLRTERAKCEAAKAEGKRLASEYRNWQDEERAVRSLFVTLVGSEGDVYSRSQRRPGKVTPGSTDLEIFFPAPINRSLKWEVKHGAGELSPAQLRYRDHCLRCGEWWGEGGRADAEAWLIDQGLAVRLPDGRLRLR